VSQTPSPAVDQISADGKFRWDGAQWVPIPKGRLEPTPWTRPMQLTVASWFAAQTLFTIVLGSRYLDRVLTAVLFGALAVVWVAAAVAANRGSLRLFRIARYWFALTALSAFVHLRYLTMNPLPAPGWELIGSEVMSIWGLGLFVWLTIGARRYGPWAMREPRGLS